VGHWGSSFERLLQPSLWIIAKLFGTTLSFWLGENVWEDVAVDTSTMMRENPVSENLIL
jgi:hypothetical protein